jgi:hypothetical protein
MATRAPDWTEDELDAVLLTYTVLWNALQTAIPDRTPGAIGYIRSGIHAVHQGQSTTYLSERLKRALEEHRGRVRCPECGVRL